MQYPDEGYIYQFSDFSYNVPFKGRTIRRVIFIISRLISSVTEKTNIQQNVQLHLIAQVGDTMVARADCLIMIELLISNDLIMAQI